MKTKKTTALLLVLVMFFTMITLPVAAQGDNSQSIEYSSSPVSFSDVSSSHWAYGAITWMAGKKILNGVGDNKFLPNDVVTREQFARIMVVALQLKINNSYAPSFQDVPKNTWAFPFVETAKLYLTGWDGGENALDYFKPTMPAVREDMAVALVKALNLQNEVVDKDSILSKFSDQSSISANLRKYVAIAVRHKIINGVDTDGKITFEAQQTLTRAQASVLVYNALITAGDKVTYDDIEKVTYDDTTTIVPAESYGGATVSYQVEGEKIKVSWTRNASTHFNGYKVVLSKTDATPVYPDNGYYQWITNRDTTSTLIFAGAGYNGGSDKDVGGKLLAGVPYYLSITTVYDDRKVPGNSIKVTLPGKYIEVEDTPLPLTSIRYEVKDDGILLKWNAIQDDRFSGYKVVLSKGNSNPSYPDQGYLEYITDPDTTSILLTDQCDYHGNNDFSYDFQSGVNYYARITVLYDNNKKTNSNVVQVRLP